MFLWKSFKEMCDIHMIHVMIRVFMWPMVSTSRVLHEPPGNQYLAEPAAAESLEEDQIQA